MIQDKLDVVKQAMARVNIDILGISELKWTITGKFNSDDHHIYTIVDKKWSYPQSQQKSLKCSTWVQSPKWKGKPFNITAIQGYAPTTNAKETEVEQFYEDLQDLLKLIPKEDVLFITRDWNAKAGSQEILGVTGKFCHGLQDEAGQRLIELCQENTLVIANTPSNNTREDLTHDHQMVKTQIRLIIFFAAKDGNFL